MGWRVRDGLRLAWVLALAALPILLTAPPPAVQAEDERAGADLAELEVTFPPAVQEQVIELVTLLGGRAQDPDTGKHLGPPERVPPPQPPSVIPTVRKALRSLAPHAATLHGVLAETIPRRHEGEGFLRLRLRAPDIPAWWERWVHGWKLADAIEAGGLPLRTAITTVDLVPPWPSAPVEEHVIELRCPLDATPRTEPPQPRWEIPGVDALRATAKAAAPRVLFTQAGPPEIVVDRIRGRRTVHGWFQVHVRDEDRDDHVAVLRVCEALQREHGLVVTSLSLQPEIDDATGRYIPPGIIAMRWSRVQRYDVLGYLVSLITVTANARSESERTLRVRLPWARVASLVRVLEAPRITVRVAGEDDVLRPWSPARVDQGPLQAELVLALRRTLGTEPYGIAALRIDDRRLSVRLVEALDPHTVGPWDEAKARIEARLRERWPRVYDDPTLRVRVCRGRIEGIAVAARDPQGRPTRVALRLAFDLRPPEASRRTPTAPRNEPTVVEKDLEPLVPDGAQILIGRQGQDLAHVERGLLETHAAVIVDTGAAGIADLTRILGGIEVLPGVTVRTVYWKAGEDLQCEVRRVHALFPIER